MRIINFHILDKNSHWARIPWAKIPYGQGFLGRGFPLDENSLDEDSISHKHSSQKGIFRAYLQDLSQVGVLNLLVKYSIYFCSWERNQINFNKIAYLINYLFTPKKGPKGDRQLSGGVNNTQQSPLFSNFPRTQIQLRVLLGICLAFYASKQDQQKVCMERIGNPSGHIKGHLFRDSQVKIQWALIASASYIFWLLCITPLSYILFSLLLLNVWHGILHFKKPFIKTRSSCQ